MLALLCLTGCAQSASPTESHRSGDLVAAASSIKMPGTAQPCQNTATDSTNRCSLATVTARAAADDVAGQLRTLGLTPSVPKCEQVTKKTPESCTVQVVVSGRHALTFVASPHLLPNAPARFEGVDTVLLAQ